MFTGIVEEKGVVISLQKKKGCLLITVKSSFARELRKGESIAHNGICLTVIKATQTNYTCEAIKETLKRTNLGKFKKGDHINLERSMKISDRLDGHLVQGHVDQTGICSLIKAGKSEWIFTFEFDECQDAVVVPKGSVCVNGVSLTVVKASKRAFTVAVIPHTFQNTTFSELKLGDLVNIEFDIIGKYVARLLQVCPK